MNLSAPCSTAARQGVFLALVPDNSKEQSVVYRPQHLIVAAEW
ncbi:unnamed protein product [Ectocarpus sp. CCAP 1310/34]|nr:unnamed protein product [Ectocarpus sp. CCAP 1310/34]